jgi:ubiquitin carboxyl-terminal hydrolase 25
MGKMDIKTVEDEKFSEDDLKRFRVGGRLVTRKEIIRSKKCETIELLHTPKLTIE